MIKTDVVVIGAGPCGLFQVFELGLLGINCEVIDSIRQPGGQCTELYPDKPIYDIPAVPVCTGSELIENLLKQIEPFDYNLHLGQEVQTIERQPDDTFIVGTSKGNRFNAKAIVIAGGVGSFQPRPLRVPDTEKYVDTSLHYRVRDASEFAGKEIAILGGGDSALDWVVELAKSARKITLVHRRDEYRAAAATVAKMRELEATGKVRAIESAKVTALHGTGAQIESITVTPKTGEPIDVEVEQVLVFFGLAPQLGPVANWGLDINRKTINVDTEKFQSSEPGIYAVGDIGYYPGKKKLILSGFHEAALAAFAIKQQIEPDKKVHLQYTTTSPIMHERLGLSD
ncbi:MAG: NAD(P)/FAD-dependent oxidoreductase [Gammaproteobacteria bacterium]|nr:NAD(P)/FAD-dependent oxidoreductase [Gammaproteobacteria bacterium]